MKLNRILGSYSFSQQEMPGGFQLNGAGAPTILRDGTKVSSAQKMFTVAFISTGLFEVTYIKGFPLPGLPFIYVNIEQAATPTTPCVVRYVKGSWNPSTRKFRVQIQTVANVPAASNADAGDRITFLVIGAVDSPGVDPA